MQSNLRDLQAHLDRGGLLGGLAFLNARVAHRFTAVYWMHDMAMNVQALYDKQQESTANPFAVVPLRNSFCEMAMAQGHFVATDSPQDARLDGNPYQSVLGSYVGLPLVTTPGELYGTLCHYDLVARPIEDEEFAFLQSAARLLPRYLKTA
ncbi:GAF domain-containing protein [Xylophilus sp.]|uniref:GAF domain-containing protein n=1 Tax=Xylophilus sp. TaxID=2653893 RepID=UPI0013B80309|nr:GAF domain-containing protein [Xylophilus sp.]KAF1047966.1 MAG: hypothetical protein GAK38_01677 [Xylophilus sp.]